MKNRNKYLIVLALVAVLGVSLFGCQTADTALFEAGRSAMRMAGGLQPGKVEVDGKEIAYLQRDGDGPTIVFVHGFASEKDVWLRFVNKLPRHYELIAIDLPGHGESSRDPDYHYDIPNMVTLVDGAIAGVTQTPVHLVGTSLGGMIATLYAAAHPGAVQSLALYAPAGVYPSQPSEFQQALANGENPLIASNPREFDRLMEIVFYDPPPLVWPVSAALQRYCFARASFHRKIWNDLWPGHPTVDESLPNIEVPVLLVWGRQDEVLDVSSAQVYSELLPDVRTHIIDRAGHAIINEKPAHMARLYREFLEQLAVHD